MFCGATDAALAAIAEEKRVRKTEEVFLLFSMGSQFTHLIAQALGRLGVFCLVADPASVTAADVRAMSPKGIILSGGPHSVVTDPPPFDSAIFDIGVPVLGICLGFQMWAHHIGLRVDPTKSGAGEFGQHAARLRVSSLLFSGCPAEMQVLQSHHDCVLAQKEDPKKIRVTAFTDHSPVAAAQFRHLYGVQFHPEVTETTHGLRIFENFCFRICSARDRYPAEKVAEKKVAEIREAVGDKRVLLALSGGSDSSTVAYLLKKALEGQPRRVRAIYIRGIDRPDDERHAREFFGCEPWLEFVAVDKTEAFLAALRGKTEMHEKRVAMRNVYKKTLENEARRRRHRAAFISQGTLYTDLSESGSGHDAGGARKAQIKLHHNVNLGFSVPELTPLADYVKDSGRSIGRAIGVPEELLMRHPFPGPGLAVRIEGEVTREKLAVARTIDGIYIEELRTWNLYHTVWQAGAYVTESFHTTTKGDDAGKGRIVMLWAVWSVNGFTARAAKLPPDFLEHVTRRICNEVRGVGAVCYRCSDKPPSTIEVG